MHASVFMCPRKRFKKKKKKIEQTNRPLLPGCVLHENPFSLKLHKKLPTCKRKNFFTTNISFKSKHRWTDSKALPHYISKQDRTAKVLFYSVTFQQTNLNNKFPPCEKKTKTKRHSKKECHQWQNIFFSNSTATGGEWKE